MTRRPMEDDGDARNEDRWRDGTDVYATTAPLGQPSSDHRHAFPSSVNPVVALLLELGYW